MSSTQACRNWFHWETATPELSRVRKKGEKEKGRSTEEKWFKHKSGSMVPGPDNVSVLFMGRRWWI